jgi:hypothetical protein
VSLIQYDWCPYKKGMFRDRCVQGKTPYAEEVRAWEMFLQAMECRDHQQKARDWARGENKFSLRGFLRNQPYLCFALELPAYRSVRQ